MRNRSGWHSGITGVLCSLAILTALPTRLFAANDVPDRILDAEQVRMLATSIIPRKKAPAEWADAITQALAEVKIRPLNSNICSVMAVIEQESNFAANPEIRNLGRISEKALIEKFQGVPFVSAEIMGFLKSKPTPQRNYLKLIRAARTERDLDIVWRNIAYYLFDQYATVALMSVDPFKSLIERGNEITTIGSMQVSLKFAQAEVERERGRPLNLAHIWQLRDELYTLDGGVRYGTRMLLGYYAGYPSKLYVFADYNAGRYSSRNAAFQFQLGKLLNRDIPLDGDLLIYGKGAVSKSKSRTEAAIGELVQGNGLGLTPQQIRHDLAKEKTYGFVETPTFQAITQLYGEVTGETAPYAMVPVIKLNSPKLSKSMSTKRFANSVYWRYQRCMRK